MCPVKGCDQWGRLQECAVQCPDAAARCHFLKADTVFVIIVEDQETRCLTKRRWQAWALETNALLLFQHDPNIRAGHLRKDGEKLTVEPIEVSMTT